MPSKLRPDRPCGGVYAGRTVAALGPLRTQPLRCLGNRQGHRGSRPGLTSLRPRHPPRRQPEPCAWSPYQAPQPSRRSPRPGARLRCRDDACVPARRAGGQPRSRRGGVAGRNNGVQRRIAVSSGLNRPPRASTGEGGPPGMPSAHIEKANSLTPPVKRAAGGFRDAGLSPLRSSPGWGPVARRPRLRSALARDTHQKPRGILLSISSHLGKYTLNVWVSSHLGTRYHRTADVGGTDGHYTAITSPQTSQPGWEALWS